MMGVDAVLAVAELNRLTRKFHQLATVSGPPAPLRHRALLISSECGTSEYRRTGAQKASTVVGLDRAMSELAAWRSAPQRREAPFSKSQFNTSPNVRGNVMRIQ